MNAGPFRISLRGLLLHYDIVTSRKGSDTCFFILDSIAPQLVARSDR